MEAKAAPADSAESAEEPDEPSSVLQEKSPSVQSGRGVKRRNSSPTLPHPPPSFPPTSPPSVAATVFVTPSKDKDESKPSSAKKRRKSTSSGLALGKTGSPSSSSSSFNPAAMTERQQMAYLLQMTDPLKKIEDSPAVVKETTTPGRVHKRNERGETPLHVACIRGDLHLATSLIDQGAEVNSTDHAGWTPLHEACNHGHPDLVSFLLGAGAGVNTHGMDGDTPLHDATINNHPQVVKLLMEHGGDPNLANENEQTAWDVCPNEEIRQLLTGTSSIQPRLPITGDATPTASPPSGTHHAQAETTESELNQELNSSNNTAKTQSQGDSAFSPTPLLLQSTHHTTSLQSTPGESATAEPPLPQKLAPVTPSRIRKRSKRGREKGKAFSNVSSSESDPELLVTVRKVPRLVDRLPASVREEGGGDERQRDGEGGRGRGKTGEGEEIEKESDSVKVEKGVEEVVKGHEGADVGELGEKEEEKEKQSAMNVKLEGEERAMELSSDEKQHVPMEEEQREESAGGESVAVEEGSQQSSAGEGEEDMRAAADKETEREKNTCEEMLAQRAEEEDTGDLVQVLPSAGTEEPASESSGDPEKSNEREEGGGRDKEQAETPPGSPESGERPGESERGATEAESAPTEIEVTEAEDKQSRGETAAADGLTSEAVSGDEGKAATADEVFLGERGEKAEQEEGGDPNRVGGGDKEEGNEREWSGKECRPEEKQSKEVEPVKLLLSIPFQHIKFKRGRGLSPLRIVRTPSRDKVLHETSVLVQHGKVESVSSLLLRGGGSGRGESGLTVERMDVNQPQENRGKGGVSEKQAKLGTRKTLHIAKKTRELGRSDEGDFGDGEGWGSGAESVWETTPPGTASTGKVVGQGRGRLLSSGGWEGGAVPSHLMENLPSRASPTLSRGSDQLSDDGDGDGDFEGLSDDSGSSGGTVVSLSTSLPIKFSGLHHQQQQQQQQHRPSPLAMAVSTTTAGSAPGGDLSAGDGVDVVNVPPQSLAETMSSPSLSVAQGERGGGNFKRTAPTTAPLKDSATLEMDEPAPVPPKLRSRPVLRSAVVQQRRENAGRIPSLSHLPFLQSHRPPRQPHPPTSPKVVYPPIHLAMYKLFSEQEVERVQLHTAHLAQQDRLLQCLEQELVRAHQRATSSTTVSVCAVLLERMLPRADALGEERAAPDNTCGLGHDGGQGAAVDERLLASLVQDVWDKFCHQRSLLLARQRHEAQALWLLQHQQWTARLKDLGFSHQVNFPTIHVPKLFC